jgi:hypothetical protein
MPQWFKDLLPNLPNWISAFFTVVIAAATIAYVRLTRGLWQETKKSADAAQKSAGAADKSADASQQTITLMRQQLDQEALRRRITVQTGVDVALKTIGLWRAKTNDLANMNSLQSLPPTDNLILPHTLVESLALIDIQEAMNLSAALNEMTLARDVIESTRNVNNKDGKNSGHFARAGEEAAKHLDAAAGKLHELVLFLGMANG